jgi:chromosome segregation ATPase
MPNMGENDILNVDSQFVEQTTEEVPSAAEAFAEEISKAYTEADLQKVREQEKSKLYPQIESLKEELNVLKQDRESRLEEEARLRAEAEAEAKRRAEEEMDVRDLLTQKEQEWAERLESERSEREKAFALLDRERHFSELQNYRNTRLEEERENIIPELIDLITGSNPDEIESSIAGLKDRSSRILESAQQALSSARREMTGSRVTVPASGPLDNNSEQKSFTAEQIASMSVSEYAKYRGKLLGQAASERGKGLFG